MYVENFWKSWEVSKGVNDDIVKYKAEELDECLSRFFAEIRKSDGSDYEPDNLRVILAALDRYLKQNDSNIYIYDKEPKIGQVQTDPYGERAFAVAAPRLWNTIPLKLRISASIDIFKKHLKRTFLSRLFNHFIF